MTTASNATPITVQPAIVAPKRFANVTSMVTSTAAYTAGYQVGALITATGVPSSGKIQNVCVNMTAGTFASSLDMVVFSAPPSGTYTDHTAFTLAAADAPLCIGIIHIKDGTSLAAAGAAIQAQTISFDYLLSGNASGNSTLTAALITRSATTLGSASAVFVNIQGEG